MKTRRKHATAAIAAPARRTSPAVARVAEQLGHLDDVVGLLLRTCDDSIKRRMDPNQRQCLMAACDDVRAVFGYAGRYLTPRERTRLGISPGVPKKDGAR